VISSIPAALRNALYKNNRDGTFTEVTNRLESRGGYGMASRSAITTATAAGLLVTQYNGVILYTTMATARSPT